MANGTKTNLAEARTVLDFSEVGVMSLVYEGVRLKNGVYFSQTLQFVYFCDDHNNK